MKYLLTLLCFVCVGKHAFAQEPFFKVVKNYFRVDPFAGQFSAFINAVKTDPELMITEAVDKTDTSLFSIQGNYKSFNPFTIRARRIEMLLAEKRRLIRSSSPIIDTIVLYQITGLFDSTEQTAKAIKREYKKINNRIKGSLPVHGEAPLTKIRGLKEGAITNHARSGSLAAPISVAWYVKDNGELALMVVLRLKYTNNRAFPSGMLSDYEYLNQYLIQLLQ